MVSSPKLNCWEIKKCGRELGGKKAGELGVCPVATERRLDGVHSGRMAGRACWVVTGSLCEGRTQGGFAKKFGSCQQCEVYAAIRRDESGHFEPALGLLERIKTLTPAL